VWAAPRFSRQAAYVVGGLLVVTYVALFFTVAWPMGRGAVWFCNLVVGMFLIAAGYQLSPLLNVIRLWLWRLWNAVVLVLEALWLALMRLLQVVVVILENTAYLLATPIDKVFGRRREIAEMRATQTELVQRQTSAKGAAAATKSTPGIGDDHAP
jgi:hypothetical protein